MRICGSAKARDDDLAQPVQLRKRRLENAVHHHNRMCVEARDGVRGHVVQCDAECNRIEKRHVAWKRLTDVGVLPFLVSLGRNAKRLERIAAAPTQIRERARRAVTTEDAVVFQKRAAVEIGGWFERQHRLR